MCVKRWYFVVNSFKILHSSCCYLAYHIYIAIDHLWNIRFSIFFQQIYTKNKKSILLIYWLLLEYSYIFKVYKNTPLVKQIYLKGRANICVLYIYKLGLFRKQTRHKMSQTFPCVGGSLFIRNNTFLFMHPFKISRIN